jgi:hypothetical protein
VIIEVGPAAKVWVGADVPEAAYPSDRSLVAETPAAPTDAGVSPVRIAVELRRNLGGLIMRALVGAEFVAEGGPARYEILVARAPFDDGDEPTCPSQLGRPLVPGLPADFAAAARSGLTADAGVDPLPGGRLRVDRAAYDLMGSSEAAFFQAGRLLRAALSAAITGDDVQGRLAQRLSEMASDRAS